MSSVVPRLAIETIPERLASAIKEAVAWGTAGIIVSTAVYGITILQAYTYFRRSGGDSPYMRIFALCSVFDTLSLVLAIDTSYKLIIADLLDPVLALNVPPVSAFESGFSVLLRTFTQWYVPLLSEPSVSMHSPVASFFAYRIWSLSKGKIVLVATILLCALSSCSLGLVIALRMYIDSYIISLATVRMRIIASTGSVLSMICDITLMISLCYYLHSKRTGFRKTDSIINQLIVYAVNRGALTVLCQAGEMVAMIFLPGRFIFIPFALVGPKLYCNTLFAT
ncbi:hypothetical protein GSI_02679 [Ganoderma sinense ZZ0214-1]|uniref:DUF6534 domain-containing protein n=1 Tax=Ganoderma sinense ZZ0214-1 TaxID=1077348 RepID=A0A2G8SM98_9APHY|nr:hypothetical protein GSI_02679 [Ganoderma sinense ZZ0214-1]